MAYRCNAPYKLHDLNRITTQPDAIIFYKQQSIIQFDRIGLPGRQGRL